MGLPLRSQRPAQSYRASDRRQRSAVVASSTVNAAAAAPSAPGVSGVADLASWMALKGVPTPLVTPSPTGGVVTTRMVRIQ